MHHSRLHLLLAVTLTVNLLGVGVLLVRVAEPQRIDVNAAAPAG